MREKLTTVMPDGSVWAVPVSIIAENRATHYAYEYGGDVKLSLSDDTIPLFESDDYEIEDWAVNNMNWSDFDGHQEKISDSKIDFQEGWAEGEKGFI